MKANCTLLLLGLFFSCKPKAIDANTHLEAVFIVKETIGCRQPVVEFTAGLEQARQIAQASADYQGYFSVLNLDSSYWQPGRKFTLTIRKPVESIVCDALGLGHPTVEVVTVE